MKILLDDHHGIGDVAMFLSVLFGVKREYPNDEIHMLVKSQVEQNLIESVGGVSKFYYYDPLNHSLRSILKLIFDLRQNRYDLGICHIGTNARFGSLLMRAIGCKKSIGSSSGRWFPNYTIPIDTSKEPFRARKNALLLKGLGISTVQENGLLADLEFPGYLTDRINSSFGNNCKVGICLGAGNTVIGGVSVNGKKWKDEYWLELIDRFISKGIKILLLGGKKELEERASEFDGLPEDFVMDLAGSLKLSESLEAISTCNLVIACDTGLGFCSALMDIPTLTLLGPSGPYLAAPYGKRAEYIYLNLDCAPCYGTDKMRDCKDRKCMNQITVDMVFDKSINMLQCESEGT